MNYGLEGILKALTRAFMYQVNCELKPEECKQLLDYIEGLESITEGMVGTGTQKVQK